MSAVRWNILLAFVWAATTELFTPANFIIGFLLGYLALWLAPGVQDRSDYFLRTRRLFTFSVFFLKELIVANIRMAYYTLAPLSRLRPGFVAVPLEALTDSELVILTNLITLTPGTLSTHLSRDRRTLYVHFMRVDNPAQLRRELKNSFERRLLEITR